ncbi:MAG: VWA domain-containing protein, partial [Colwellia sp.]|nr:VWA domain-containing protein [Colwellia sp.]
MTSYNLFLTHFHFVRPFWLLAIVVLFTVLWLLKKHRFHQSPWQKLLPPHLSSVLVEGATNNLAPSKQPLHQRLFLTRPLFIGLLSIIALAGPAWQKLPQPVYQTERGSVLIMDMSYSMYATDIKPNRLTRARFKAIDLLKKINNGDVGLIAYAGDAFVISPLTQDIKNIELLLPSLTPEIMPELGANPFAALTLAHQMLTNAGHLTGDIYWFTDDVDNEELSDIYDWSNKFGHRLNILGIGSQNGAPIKLPSGELLKDNKGAIVVPRLPIQKLQSLAAKGQGNYQTISNDDSDIDNLILKPDLLNNNKSKQQKSQQTGDQWQEQGAWL